MASLAVAVDGEMGSAVRDPLSRVAGNRLDGLEAALHHAFADPTLLDRALTHASARAPGAAPRTSYQRLEFLGDRVLALVVAELLYETYPDADEGDLARRLNQLVRRETCAEVARELDLGRYLRLGESEAGTGGRAKTAILGDAIEAVIAAIHLDGGFAASRVFVARLWRSRMVEVSEPPRDAKTTLQEWAQGRRLATPSYREIGRTGPDHDPLFAVAVDIPGIEGADGLGRSKREAEQKAAAALLIREGLWRPRDA